MRQAEELARKLSQIEPEAATAPDEEYPESYMRLVEQMEHIFSENISIKRSKRGGGRIVIDFSDDNEIERFIDRFRTVKQ